MCQQMWTNPLPRHTRRKCQYKGSEQSILLISAAVDRFLKVLGGCGHLLVDIQNHNPPRDQSRDEFSVWGKAPANTKNPQHHNSHQDYNHCSPNAFSASCSTLYCLLRQEHSPKDVVSSASRPFRHMYCCSKHWQAVIHSSISNKKSISSKLWPPPMDDRS